MSTCQLVKVSKMSICQLVNLSTCQHVMKFQISRSVKCHEVINFLSSFQELLVFFAIFCQLLPFFLHLFGTFHNCWQFLPPSSNFWQILPSFVFSLEFFFIFANFDIVWLLLVSFGNFLQFFLQLLPGFDSFEQFFAMFWQPLTILGKFGYFWQLLANLCFSGQILVYFCQLLLLS